MESRIFNHKKFYAVGYHSTRKEAEASKKSIRKTWSVKELALHITKSVNGGIWTYTVWAHEKVKK